MAAAASVRAEARDNASPSPLWLLLCSAVLVGMMIASDIGRVWHPQGRRVGRPATGAFGAARSSDELLPFPLRMVGAINGRFNVPTGRISKIG